MCEPLITAIIAGVLYSGCLLPVEAQNPQCPTRPVGDSTNACASTAFVQSAATAGIAATPGTVEFINTGDATGMALIPYNGNSFLGYCTTTAAWKSFSIPGPVSITNAVSNAGLIRLTVSSTVGMATNQNVWVTQVGGVPNANFVYPITVINATTIDLQGSVFGGAYTSGGLIYTQVAGNTGNITIDGVANQAIAANTNYYAGFQFFDAACTIGSIVLSSVGYGPSSTMGFNVLSNYTNVPLLGQLHQLGGTIQGSVNGQLLVSWYNRGTSEFTNSALGNTGGVLNTWTKLAGTVDIMIWADRMPEARIACGVSGTAALNRIDVGLSYQNSAVAPDYFQTGYDIAGGVGLTINAMLPFPSTAPGFYRVTGWLRTQVGTVTTGSITNCTINVSGAF